ncbi:MAG: RluA family pseudouridine synthase [Polyangiaceae bacterium]|nr:RluA family pseudouridine synthase [Polyangiaceae bacterium]MCW5791525.1 RluA family pseudouridine synthase [Polyangiaceae bacterium]
MQRVRILKRSECVRPQDAPADALVRVFRVPPEWAGRRLDTFLAAQLRSTSRTRARSIAEHSAYDPAGQRMKPSERLRAEHFVVLWRRPPDESDEPVPIDVLHEDEHLLVVEKPPLITVHPTARHHRITILSLLAAERPGEFLSLIHRLDRETSGILMLARSQAADRAFKRALEDRSRAETGQYGLTEGDRPDIGKTYLAITWGIPAPGLIDVPIEPDVDNPLRVKMRVAARSEPSTEARTQVEVLGTRGDYALVRLRLLTGRQHQIRIHLASRGTPIVGDKLYGPDERLLARAADGELTELDRQRLELPRHALHAHEYRLIHAVTGEPLTLTSPLPRDLEEFWDEQGD